MEFFKKAGDAVKKAAEAVASTAESVAKAVVSGVEKAVDKTKEVVNRVVDKTIEMAKAAARKVAEIYEAAKKIFKAVLAFAVMMACIAVSEAKEFVVDRFNDARTGVNDGFNYLIGVGSYYLSQREVEELIRKMYKYTPDIVPWLNRENVAQDGTATDASVCSKPPGAGGLRPAGCSFTGALPKAVFINGILNNHELHCATLQAIANRTCQEMTGVYNATGGPFADVVECVDNIQRKASPSVDTMKEAIFDLIGGDPAQEMTIYAHSQGGLITQAALVEVKTKLKLQFMMKNWHSMSEEELNAAAEADASERLSKLNIVMAGTAKDGWPEGPKYTSYVNRKDPVPIIIDSRAEEQSGSDACRQCEDRAALF